MFFFHSQGCKSFLCNHARPRPDLNPRARPGAWCSRSTGCLMLALDQVLDARARPGAWCPRSTWRLTPDCSPHVQAIPAALSSLVICPELTIHSLRFMSGINLGSSTGAEPGLSCPLQQNLETDPHKLLHWMPTGSATAQVATIFSLSQRLVLVYMHQLL